MINKKGYFDWKIALIILFILGFVWYINSRNNNSINKETAKCIASKSKLYVSRTCPVCEQQKQILSDYIDYFNIIDCIDNTEECKEKNILQIPTWIINNNRYLGIKSLEELKTLTGC